MSLERLHHLLDRAGARRLGPALPVWELAAPFWRFTGRARRYASARRDLLDAALALPGPVYLVTDENPQEHDVGGPWAHAAARTWPVPQNAGAEPLLERLLAPGAWWLYAARGPVDAAALPDAFQCPPEELVDFAFHHGISLCVQAALRNDPWRVFVEAMRDQQRVAA